jgi:hypothetical protein
MLNVALLYCNAECHYAGNYLASIPKRTSLLQNWRNLQQYKVTIIKFQMPPAIGKNEEII